jgi:RNA polymerase sigma factor (sigma-70 family)
MKQFYNQRQDLQTRKRRFNPDFWEVPVEWEILCQFSEAEGCWHETQEDAENKRRLRDYAEELMPEIHKLFDRVLTERQREIVQLYFLEQRTQREVAEMLGISVSSVSQHLFGKRRAGKVIGGAIPRLRKELLRSGLVGS